MNYMNLTEANLNNKTNWVLEYTASGDYGHTSLLEVVSTQTVVSRPRCLYAANHGGLAASITVWLWYVHLV